MEATLVISHISRIALVEKECGGRRTQHASACTIYIYRVSGPPSAKVWVL